MYEFHILITELSTRHNPGTVTQPQPIPLLINGYNLPEVIVKAMDLLNAHCINAHEIIQIKEIS